jgi:hypothetical protein
MAKRESIVVGILSHYQTVCMEEQRKISGLGSLSSS